MFELKESRDITNAIRGLAIMIVVYAHFASNFANDFYERWLTEYASSIIAVFFVLSGFGMYQSLERRFGPGGDGVRPLWKYMFDRAIRVYPLYWLAMLIMPLLVPFPFNDELFSLSPRALLVWLGIPITRNPDLWFVTAIIQCYWAAPLLYLLIRKVGVKRFCFGLAGFTGLALFISMVFYLQKFNAVHIPAIGRPKAFFYKGFFFGNIVLFAMGMLMVPAAAWLGPWFKRNYTTAGFAVLFAGLVYLTRFPNMVFTYSELLLVPALYLACFAFCLSAIINRPKFPAWRFFELTGRQSYTMYLFHYQFLYGLALLGLIGGENYGRSAVIAVAAFPALLLMCIGIGRVTSVPVARFDRWVNERLKTSLFRSSVADHTSHEVLEDGLVMKPVPVFDRQEG